MSNDSNKLEYLNGNYIPIATDLMFNNIDTLRQIEGYLAIRVSNMINHGVPSYRITIGTVNSKTILQGEKIGLEGRVFREGVASPKYIPIPKVTTFTGEQISNEQILLEIANKERDALKARGADVFVMSRNLTENHTF
ncbi:MAG: hypothetical protein AABX66_00230 [Nanoarchaeota archaeon]